MMADLILLLLVSIFIPLFPMSMVFNAIVDKITNCWIRILIFSIWPLTGLMILHFSSIRLPDWLTYLALGTSMLYALRILTLREVNQWTGFLATSLWSLLWLAVIENTSASLLYGYAISMSIPLVMLLQLSAGLEKRYGAAYTGLYGGLARSIPRFAGVLVTVVVAAIATPFFPTFFIMLDLVVATVSSAPLVAIMLLLIWLLWSWAGARLIQGLIVGRASEVDIDDLNTSTVSIFSLLLLVLAIYGIYLSGVIL